MRALFKSVNLIGDALYVGPALRAWIEKNHKSSKDEVYLETLKDHITPLYEGMVRDFPWYVTWFKVVHERPEGEFDFEHHFNVSRAFHLSDEKKQHVATSYAELLAVEVPDISPVYHIDYEDAVKDSDLVESVNGSIIISAFSMSCQSRDAKTKGLPPNKMLPWPKWKPMMELLRHEFPDTPIRFVGAPTDMIPNGYAMEIVEPGEYMLGIPLNTLALIMKHAKLVVTIDNGMSHLAATQKTPTFLMYPRCLGTHYILPPNPNMAYVHMDPVSVSPAQLRYYLNHKIQQIKTLEKK
jgi:ADP-heptose:LPS heptosyltransferase